MLRIAIAAILRGNMDNVPGKLIFIRLQSQNISLCSSWLPEDPTVAALTHSVHTSHAPNPPPADALQGLQSPPCYMRPDVGPPGRYCMGSGSCRNRRQNLFDDLLHKSRQWYSNRGAKSVVATSLVLAATILLSRLSENAQPGLLVPTAAHLSAAARTNIRALT